MPGSTSLNQASYAFRYHNRWRELADTVARRLSPYIAVHWRMEQVVGFRRGLNLQTALTLGC